MKIPDGFSAADSTNLPNVDHFMLMHYMFNDESFNAAEIRGAKILHSTRDAYVDSAIGYVAVKRQDGKCIVQCRVTPEHRIRTKMYTVTATVCGNEEKMDEIKCEDCAASEGGCKHSISFFMWLIKRSEEPSVTSIKCYWAKPRLSDMVTKGKYILARNLTKRKNVTAEPVPLFTKGDFIQECKKRKISDVLVMNYYSQEKKETLGDLTVFNLAVKCCITNGNDFTFEQFKTFCEEAIKAEKIKQIQQNTVGQANCKLWHNLRKTRLTASKIYEASRCKTTDGALVKMILGGYKVPETSAIKRGKLLENKVIKQLESELNKHIKKCGFILISPIMGASPDGLSDEFVIEVKCPSSKKTMKNYITNGMIAEKHKAQIMLQMHATNMTKGLFSVADPDFENNQVIHKCFIDYDKTYVDDIIHAAEDMWKQMIFPKVVACCALNK